ncbi:MAG: hypothetical protein ACOZB1_00995 [Pseudomonadota bacterium]|jgi:hypothetical protein
MKRALLPALWLPLTSAAVEPSVTLHDRARLEAALQAAAPCCIVDARPVKARKAKPIADAVVYRPGLRINPTSAVVVIADSDRETLRVGRALAAASGARQVIAVQGGFKTWQEATRPSGIGAFRFVIPSDTCQQGTPLQEFLQDKK